MKKMISILLVLLLVCISVSAGAATIKTKGLSEEKLYDLYAQVQAQLQLNELSDKAAYLSVKSYEDIERNPGKHRGEKIWFSGTIVQVMEGSGEEVQYRIAGNGNYSEIYLVDYQRPSGSERFLEDDKVMVYAVFNDLITYSSTVGMAVTVPSCTAALITKTVTNKEVTKATTKELKDALETIEKALQGMGQAEKKQTKVTKANYDDYARNEARHQDEAITFSGKVLQVVEGSYSNVLRVAVGNDSSKVIYVEILSENYTLRILDSDKVTVRGTYAGLQTYTSTYGGEITIPACIADSIDLQGGYKAPKQAAKDKEGYYKLTKKTFEDYSRRPGKHEDELITFSGKVVQVIESSGGSEYRIAVDNDKKLIVYASITNDKKGTRVLEDDKVTVKAKFTGLLTYTTTIGSSVTIPKCEASSITVPGKKTAQATKDKSGKFKVTKKNYEAFARDASTYENQQITFSAKVIEAVESGSTTICRLAVDKNSDCIFYATLSEDVKDIRILEDDILTVEGTSTGLYSYQSTRSGVITIPSCRITKYTVSGYKKGNVGKADSNGYFSITKKNYGEYARNPDAYKGNKIKFKGKVVQVSEGSGGNNTYRIAVGKNYDCMFYVTYKLSSSSRILENDIVTVYGEFGGIYTYTTILGGSVSVPSLQAKRITK